MSVDDKLRELIVHYDNVVKNISHEAAENQERASGGVLRSARGKLQEKITEELVYLAWESLGQEKSRININSRKIPIEISPKYIERLDDEEIKSHINANIENYVYKISVDKHVFIDEKFVIGIECKSYTENAMLKRILVDFDFLQLKHPEISCYLFQLESQLGGDYSALRKKTFGSTSTHAIMSRFKCKLNIFTFLKGERKIDRPIFDHYKPLELRILKSALKLLKQDLRRYTRNP